MFRVGLLTSVFIFASHSIFTLAEECRHYPTGNYSQFVGAVMDDSGLVATADPILYQKKQIFKMAVRDLVTGKSFAVPEGIMAYPVAKNIDFSLILLRGFETQIKQLYLLDAKGRLIETIQLPELKNDPALSEFYQFQLSDDGHSIYASSNKNILIFDRSSRKWDIVFSVDTGQSNLGWFNSGQFQDDWFNASKNMVNALFSSQTVLFRWPEVFENGDASERKYVMMDLKTHKILREFRSATYTTLTMSSHRMIFDEGPDLQIWNLDDGVVSNLKIDALHGQQGTHMLFEGPQNTLGLAIGSIGKVYLFNLNGDKIQEYQTPKFSEIEKVGRSGQLFLRLTDNLGSVLFDSATGEMTGFPDLLGKLLTSSSVFFSKNKIYFNFYSELNDQSMVGVVDLDHQCLRTDQVGNIIDRFPSQRPDQIPLLYFLGLEEKLPHIKPSTVTSLWTRHKIEDELGRSLLSLVTTAMTDTVINAKMWLPYLNALSPSLVTLNNNQKESILDAVAIKMADRTKLLNSSGELGSLLKELSTSKIANLYIEALKPYFGIRSEGRTDFALVQQSNKAVPLILGTSVIDNDPTTMTSLGFALKKLEPIDQQMEIKKSFQFQWHMQNQIWQASGESRLVNLTKLINKAVAPNYKNLWDDKKLVGAMVISSNLLEGFDSLARKIFDYFRGEGFFFGMPGLKAPDKSESLWYSLSHLYVFPFNTPVIDNGKAWLQKMIESGELDYWVKEAHSGGNDEVVWLARKNILLRGTRNIRGRREEIYLLFPASVDPKLNGKEVAIRDHELAQWLQAREQKRGKDLVYVNASCWSANRAKQELIAAKSPLLIEIASKESTWTFANKSSNHERLLIDMLRDGRSYPEMQQKLSDIKESSNPFIFPNEDRYDSEIWGSMSSALDYSVELTEIKTRN